jgi:hypothetical protein
LKSIASSLSMPSGLHQIAYVARISGSRLIARVVM